jgi:uncharacterized membrane protein
MGGAHSHGSAPPQVGVDRRARVVLLGALALTAALTVAGMVVWWPSAEDLPEEVPFAGEGVTEVTGSVVEVGEPCPVIIADPTAPRPPGGNPEFPEGCNALTVTVAGRDAPVTLQAPPYVARAGLEAGDEVSLFRLPAQQGLPQRYAFVSIERDTPLALLAIVFVVAVAVVARLRGLLALVGLGFAGLVLGYFLLPALLAGENGLGVAFVGSSAIMFVVLYLAHGPSLRTSAALAGTVLGVGITALIGLWGIGQARLAGVSDETGEQLLLYAPDLDYQGLLASAVVIAGLGVLNDVTITQSSAVWELRAAAPTMGRRELFTSGMRIGRDHIASTIYTIVFVYAGTALAVLMLISIFDRPILATLGDESIAEEIVRTLASAIGLVLAVPLTTAIAALTVSGPQRSGR